MNSLYELENYKAKKEFAIEKLEQKKIADKKRDDYYRPRINKEIFDIEWKDETTPIFKNQIILGNEIFDEEYFWSKGKGVSKKKIEEINNRINNLSDEEYLKITEVNCVFVTYDFIYGVHWRRSNLNIYMDKLGFLNFRVEKLTIKWWRNEREYYDRLFIMYDNIKEYYFMLPSSKDWKILLDDYNIVGNLLIKKKI